MKAATKAFNSQAAFANILVGQLEAKNVFVPSWKVSKDGVVKLIYTSDTV